MKEIAADLWSLDMVKCVTTNGTVLADGSNVMGGGCAREAAARFPWLPAVYGATLARHGVHVVPVGPLVMFPVKHTVGENADPALILRSASELMILADLYGWSEIALPRPGCGLGCLDWQDVGALLTPLLDERVTVVSYPGRRAA